MASAFNVCAIASHWRVSVQPGQNEDDGYDIPDPQWSDTQSTSVQLSNAITKAHSNQRSLLSSRYNRKPGFAI